jgi:hypothetical protein
LGKNAGVSTLEFRHSATKKRKVAIYYMIAFIWNAQSRQICKTESPLVVVRRWGLGEWGYGCGEDEDVVEVMRECAQLCGYTKKHWSVCFKRMNFMAYDLDLIQLLLKKKKRMKSDFPNS